MPRTITQALLPALLRNLRPTANKETLKVDEALPLNIAPAAVISLEPVVWRTPALLALLLTELLHLLAECQGEARLLSAQVLSRFLMRLVHSCSLTLRH